MNASRVAALGVALAVLGCSGGCSGPRPDPWGQAAQEQGIAVEVVRRPVRVATGPDGRPSAQEVRRVVAELQRFVGGNLGALHLYLPDATTGAAVLAEALVPLGVNPRKLRTTLPRAGTGRHGFTAVAERFVAHAPACPSVDLAGAAFGPNEPRAGLRCTGLANLAAQVSDPADLLLNGAVAPPDPERATMPVARYRGTVPPSPPPALSPPP